MKEVFKNGKIGVRIVVHTLINGSKVIGTTGINDTKGEQITEGYWASSTLNNKVNKLSKELGIPKYNHFKHNRYTV